MPKTFSTKPRQATFPAPRYRTVKDIPTGAQKAHLFFEYWASLSEVDAAEGGKQADFTRVKIYRTWPVCNFQLVEPERKDHVAYLHDGAIPFAADNYRQWFIDNYHSGSWQCMLFERKGAGEIMLMECFFDAIDWEKPPRVDLRTVLWNHRANAELLKYYRDRNIAIPGDSEFKEIEEMSTGTALLQETIRSQTEEARAAREENKLLMREVIESKLEAAASKPEGPTNIDAVATAVQGITQMVKDGAAVAIDISRMNAQNQAKQVDGVGIFKDALEVSRGLNGQPEVFMKMVIDSAERQTATVVQSNKEMLDYLRQRDQTAATAQKSDLKQLVETATEMQEFGKLMGWSRRGGSDDAAKDSGGGWFGRAVEKIVENPQAVASVTGMVTTGLQVLLALMGQKPAPAVTPVPAPTATTPVPAAETKPEPRKPSEAEQLEQFLTFIETPFLHHFFGEQEGRTGETFARDFLAVVQNGDGTIDWNPNGPATDIGRSQYAILRQNGLQKFDRMLRGYQPIWSKVQGFSIQKNGEPVPKYYQFLQQFMNYGARMANA